MKKTDANKNFEITLKCPYCEYYSDLLDFVECNDNLEDVYNLETIYDINLEAQCPKCKKDFMIEIVWG